MHDFVLVDLYSQIEFLPHQVRNGSQKAFLRWLSERGEVREWRNQGHTVYIFRSRWGIEHAFTFPQDGDIYVQGKYVHMREISA